MTNEWKSIPTPKDLHDLYYHYELPLARAFYHIERRGVATDAVRLEELKGFLLAQLEDLASLMSDKLSRHIAFSKLHAERMDWERKDYFNLASPKDVATILKSRGLVLPKNRLTHSETTGEDALNQLYAESGDQILMEVLRAREYSKILGTYVNAKLHDGILYSAYRVTGTVTGRRSARKNLFGFGTNAQNLPKHSQLGHRFRRCIRARDGKILISCDQVQAEDFIVSGLIADIGGDFSGLRELQAGTDRHSRLASKLFNKPEAECGKNTIERFMGKKTRHAGNYDMGHDEFARQLVKEGFTGFTPASCGDLLKIFHRESPGIKGIYHKWVQDQISSCRMLRTPFARERVFLSARPYSDNRKVFKEAYAFDPQSTVGDNTGLSILSCELNNFGLVVMDSHDAATLEVDDNPSAVSLGVSLLNHSFTRDISFTNGLTIRIPIEFEIGYNLEDTTSFKNTEDTLAAYRRCKEENELHQD